MPLAAFNPRERHPRREIRRRRAPPTAGRTAGNHSANRALSYSTHTTLCLAQQCCGPDCPTMIRKY
eukprot:4519107-Lingulodinium_polyedra.AAC.1